MSNDALIIDHEIQAGETFTHDGSIIFKVFVPDNVTVNAKDGGILLEQGGGDRLFLSAKCKGSSSVNINNISGDNINIVVSGSHVVINGSSKKSTMTGITAYADIGDNSTLITDYSVHMKNIGKYLSANIEDSMHAGNIGAGAQADIGDSLHAGDIYGGIYDVGDSAKVGDIYEGTRITAGDSIRGGYAAGGVVLEANDMIHLEGAAPDVDMTADDGIRIGQKKGPTNPPKDPSGPKNPPDREIKFEL